MSGQAKATAQEILKSVFTNPNDNLVTLNTTQANKFIDYIVDESVVLKDAKVERMNDPQKEIAFIDGFNKPLRKATSGTAMDANKRSKATTSKKTIVTTEFIGEFEILDDDLEDNIEKGGLKDHLMRMMSKQISLQLEDVFLYGRKVAGLADDSGPENYLDGMISKVEKAGNVIDARNTAIYSNAEVDRVKMTDAYKAIPSKFRSLANKIYMNEVLTLDYENKYNTNLNTIPRDSFAGRTFVRTPWIRTTRPVAVNGGGSATLTANATAGDTTLTVDSTASFTTGDEVALALGESKEFTTTVTVTNGTTLTLGDAVPFDYDFTEATENAVNEVTLDGTDVLMTPANNMIWGVQRNIRIEADRQPRTRSTIFVITMRVATEMMNEDQAVVIKNLKEATSV